MVGRPRLNENNLKVYSVSLDSEIVDRIKQDGYNLSLLIRDYLEDFAFNGKKVNDPLVEKLKDVRKDFLRKHLKIIKRNPGSIKYQTAQINGILSQLNIEPITEAEAIKLVTLFHV